VVGGDPVTAGEIIGYDTAFNNDNGIFFQQVGIGGKGFIGEK
jgi:hypothetical protein